MEILIIKLGAKGDVLRTLPILLTLKKKYPGSKITWITKKDSFDILRLCPEIDKLLALPVEIKESFDILYNFDIDKDATLLAKNIHADKKYGFYEDSSYPMAFNIKAEYYLNTIFDDDLKKNNTKTYQEMMFEAADLPYDHERYKLKLNDKQKEYGLNFLKRNSINKPLIGLHMGASSRWPSKVWHSDNVKEFIRLAIKKYDVLLLAGPNEVEEHKKLVKELNKESIFVYQNNPHNSDLEFLSLVNVCNKMICSDSFSLHASLALGKQTIGLFFCTSPNEVEGYGLLKKIVSDKLMDFFPEQSDIYNEDLVKSISAKEVLKELS